MSEVKTKQGKTRPIRAASGKPLKSRLADGFVMMAIALVAFALCIGLVLQAGLSLWLAGAVALGAYLTLLTVHSLFRGAGNIEQLRGEIDTLRAEVAALKGIDAGAALQRATAPQTAKPLAGSGPQPAAASGPAPAAGTMPAVPLQPQSLQLPTSQPPVAQSPTGQPLASQPLASQPPPPQPPPPQPPPPQPVLTRPSPVEIGRVVPPGPPSQGAASAATNARPQAAVPAGSAPAGQPVGAPRRPAEQVTGIVRAPSAAATAAPPTAAPSAAAPPTAAPSAAMRPASAPPASSPASPSSGEPPAGWTFRPGDPELGNPLAGALAAPAPGAMGPAVQPPRASAPPPLPPVLAPREAEVEMINGLIRKLADEVNASDAKRLPAPRPAARDGSPRRDAATGPRRDAATGTEALIDRSVEALRGTATTMRAAPSAGAGRLSDDHDSDGDVEDDVVTQPARGPHAPSRPSAEDRAADPDFDVEALMRRAQPIATMTSAPPPLPSALDPAPALLRPERQSFEHDTAEELAALASRVEPTIAETAARRRDAADGVAGDLPGADADASGWDDDAIAEAMADAQPAGARAGDLDEATIQRLTAIADALDAGRVEVFLEPILDIEMQQARHYEVLLQLSDENGNPVDIDRLDGAGGDTVLPLLDSLRLSHTAYVARRLDERKKPGSVFSSFTGPSLTSEAFLSRFADVVSDQESIAGQLVLAFDQSEVRRFRAPEWATMREMRELGFRFALRAVTDLDMDFDQLVESGFAFVKLEADVFLDGLPAPGDVLPAADICRYLADRGLGLVVDGIADEGQRARIFGFGVALGQGQLFGGPRRMKAPVDPATRSAA